MVEATAGLSRRHGLSVAGYERVFSVLERCDGAASIGELKQRLVEALPSIFQVRYASFFTGSTLRGALSDQDALISDSSRAQRMYEEYLQRWSEYDVYGTPVAVKRLTHRGVAVLSAMTGLSAASQAYVERFLLPGGLVGSAAIRLQLAYGAVGLVGLFGPDPTRFASEDARGLELLAQRLSALCRLLPSSDRENVLDGIRGRQRDVALLVGQGLTNADIGARLHLAEDTVKKYVSRVLAATGCRTRTELALSISAAAS